MNITTKLVISPPQIYALTVITSPQIFVGSISNAVVLATILLGQRHYKTPADIMVLNLSVADLISCLSYLPWLTFQLIHGLHNEQTEYYFISLYSFSMHCGENAVFALTLDRCLAVCFPLRYRSIMTPKITLLVTVCIWITGFAFAVGNLVSKYLNTWCEIHIAFSIVDWVKMMSIVALNGILFHQARKQAARMNFGNVNRSTKLVFAISSAYKALNIALVYVVTSLPCSLLFFVTLSRDKREWQKWQIGISCFTFLNSCINPFIYSYRNARFRQMFGRVTKLISQT